MTDCLVSEWPMVEIGQVTDVGLGQSPPGSSVQRIWYWHAFLSGQSALRRQSHNGASKRKCDDCSKDSLRRQETFGVISPCPCWTNQPYAEKICIGRGLERPIENTLEQTSYFLCLSHSMRSLENGDYGQHGIYFASINQKDIKNTPNPLAAAGSAARDRDGDRGVSAGDRRGAGGCG